MDDRRKKKREKRLREKRERRRDQATRSEPDDCVMRAAWHLRAGLNDLALSAAREAAALEPDLESAHGIIAQICAEQGQWKEATEAALALHGIAPETPRYWEMVVEGCLRQNLPEEAARFVDAEVLPRAAGRRIPARLRGILSRWNRMESPRSRAGPQGRRAPVPPAPGSSPDAQSLGPLFDAAGVKPEGPVPPGPPAAVEGDSLAQAPEGPGPAPAPEIPAEAEAAGIPEDRPEAPVPGPAGSAAPRRRGRPPGRRTGAGRRSAAGGPPSRPARVVSPPSRTPPEAPAPPVEFSLRFERGPAFEALENRRSEGPEALALRLSWERLLLLGDYDDLLCLTGLAGVDRYAFQVETVRRVLQQFRGRVLLADEVGLGKTIEAGMILKEYVLRGLVRSALVLVPSPLVGQWAEEISSKFGLEFETTDGREYRRDPDSFWAQERVVASIQTTRRSPTFERVTGREYDLVIVDEAHALKNRSSANWKLVNALKKRFLLLLTATPVQNDLDELYNLVTLLKPGVFQTPAEFRRQFVDREDPRRPANADRLREILRTVMVRNSRAAADVRLPPRYAATHVVEEDAGFREFYGRLSAFLRARLAAGGDRMAARTLLMEAGSSPEAARGGLARLREREPETGEIGSLLHACKALGPPAKCAKLVEILRAGRDAKTVVFTQFLATLSDLARALDAAGIPFATFTGSMDNAAKDAAVERFRSDVPVLLSGESGGQGRNLQFANALVNFDVPWNPMRIEQRIGRIHRIGQTRDVFVFNLAAAGTVEQELLRVLDEKIHLFEMVVGEVGMILGNLDDERDFSEIVMDLWAGAADEAGRQAAFERLGEELVRAREAYAGARAADEALFAEEYEA